MKRRVAPAKKQQIAFASPRLWLGRGERVQIVIGHHYALQNARNGSIHNCIQTGLHHQRSLLHIPSLPIPWSFPPPEEKSTQRENTV